MSLLWFRTIFAAASLIYLCTLLVGILGNSWVVASVLRTTKKAGGHGLPNGLPCIRPSDRLRKYIWLLAALDLLVSTSLVFRVWALVLPDQQISVSSCRFHFALDHLFKFCSLTCLAAISTERYITIKKPFNNKVRKLAVQLTPIFAFLSLLICGTAILWLTFASIWTTSDGLNCAQQRGQEEEGESAIGMKMAEWIVAIGFCAQLAVIGTNYVRIVHHVRRKFWQRKARAVANSFSATASATTIRSPLGQSLSGESQRIACGTAKLVKQSSPPPPLLVVAEPKYMREMRTAIMRIAVFHLVCWLPFCLLQLGPALQNVLPNLELLNSLKTSSSISIRILDTQSPQQPGFSSWIAFLANWLTYANSAGNWVLYAALNRDLRSIIKACSERRKRSTLSHHPQLHSPYTLRKSVRRNAFQTLRLFYSINSHRSSASVECDNASGTTIICAHHQPHQNDTSLRAPCGTECGVGIFRKQSAQSAAGAIGGGGGGGGGAMEAIRKKSAHSAGAELGAFGWREGRAHTYCAPREATTLPKNDFDQFLAKTRPIAQYAAPQMANTQSAHLRVAQQIIAAVYGPRNGAASKGHPNEPGNYRKESAAERRELFAQKHRQKPMAPPPLIGVSIMGASTSSEEEEEEESMEA